MEVSLGSLLTVAVGVGLVIKAINQLDPVTVESVVRDAKSVPLASIAKRPKLTCPRIRAAGEFRASDVLATLQITASGG